MVAWKGVQKIAQEENCLSVRVRVWFRVSVKIRVRGQFSSGAIVLEPIGKCHRNISVLINFSK